MEKPDVVVIGAGPAGLCCAIHAAAGGCRVLVLEKNARPGAKLLLAGSGQCNISHDGDIRDFLSHYGGHGKFLKPALMSFSNNALVEFFRERGLATMTEADGKVFPQTRQSADVLAVLLAGCRKRGVTIRCNEPVKVITRDAELFTVMTDAASYQTRTVVITTGGTSYPQCGTTGDGYRLAASLGQPVTETAPALTPLLIRPFPFAALMGQSFEQMRFSVWREGKKVADHTGDVLFTHLGLSGPGILDASRGIRPGDTVRLSFAGAMRYDEFAADIAKRAAENPNWQVGTILAKYPIPERLNRKLLKLSGIPDDLKCAHFSATQRSALVTNCTEFPLTVAALGDYKIAMVTRGGIALENVTGGYNLQAAFSTGYLAAQGIRKRMGSE